MKDIRIHGWYTTKRYCNTDRPKFWKKYLSLPLLSLYSSSCFFNSFQAKQLSLRLSKSYIIPAPFKKKKKKVIFFRKLDKVKGGLNLTLLKITGEGVEGGKESVKREEKSSWILYFNPMWRSYKTKILTETKAQ